MVPPTPHPLHVLKSFTLEPVRQFEDSDDGSAGGARHVDDVARVIEVAGVTRIKSARSMRLRSGGHIGFDSSQGSTGACLRGGEDERAWPSHGMERRDIEGQYNEGAVTSAPSTSSVAAASTPRHRRACRSPRGSRCTRARVGKLPAPEGLDAHAGASHGVRGSELSEYRRVLAPRHGYLHDPGRYLHAIVWILQCDPWCTEAPDMAEPVKVASAIHALELSYVSRDVGRS